MVTCQKMKLVITFSIVTLSSDGVETQNKLDKSHILKIIQESSKHKKNNASATHFTLPKYGSEKVSKKSKYSEIKVVRKDLKKVQKNRQKNRQKNNNFSFSILPMIPPTGMKKIDKKLVPNDNVFGYSLAGTDAKVSKKPTRRSRGSSEKNTKKRAPIDIYF